MKPATAILTAAFAAWLGSVSTLAAACGSDFVLGDEVSAAHPASLGVAFALHDATGAGKLPLTDSVSGVQARQRADETAHRLEQQLASARPALPPTALLLVESRLWTRYATAASARAQVEAGHDAGPAQGDVVVVTAEAVLRALLDGRMAWQQAVDAGLVVVAGKPAASTRVAAILAARLAAPASALAGPAPRARS
ncbi:hypothetical protein E5S69_01260 [Cupriavidus necator]|uniref:hypothetical protein n=1 Tax=Cupriavidus necator TaxID=106590 RepID=UPI00148F7DF9|nr:hypothetical protein [Cupriavidus necator]NOV22158.1 hypothetical protein [Cupriavidus necator]